MRNAICTSGTDFGGKLLRQPPSEPIKKYIHFHCLHFFSNFLLLSAVWNSASWKWTCNNMYLFWNNVYCLGKIKSYPELLQITLLLGYLREISCNNGMVVQVGGERRKEISVWSSLGCDRKAGANSYSKEHLTERGGTGVV